MTGEEAAAIRYLDKAKRLDVMDRVIPNFGDNVVKAFDSAWKTHQESYLAKARARFELSRNHVYSSAARTPLHMWEDEIWETVFQEEASNVPAQLKQFGRWSDGSHREFIRQLNPDPELVERWWNSRSLRPRIPLPSTKEASDLEMVHGECNYSGWHRCGHYEIELVAKGVGHDSVDSIIHSAFSTVSDEALEDLREAEGVMPFGIGDPEAWLVLHHASDVREVVRTLALAARIDDLLGPRFYLALPARVKLELGLKISSRRRLTLVDEDGNEAVVFRRWSLRPFYEGINRQAPRNQGWEVIMRPDMFGKCEELYGRLNPVRRVSRSGPATG